MISVYCLAHGLTIEACVLRAATRQIKTTGTNTKWRKWACLCNSSVQQANVGVASIIPWYPQHDTREPHTAIIIWASVKLGHTLAMLIWRETINGILCCFGGNTDKWYIRSKPISMVKLNSYFFMPKCIISEYTTQKMYLLRYEILHSVTKL